MSMTGPERVPVGPRTIDDVLDERLRAIENAQRRNSREARVKEARKLGYSVVVHSASGSAGSGR